MSAPPNHNPDATLFKGGDSAQITPMQGGGGQIGGQPVPAQGLASPYGVLANTVIKYIKGSFSDVYISNEDQKVISTVKSGSTEEKIGADAAQKAYQAKYKANPATNPQVLRQSAMDASIAAVKAYRVTHPVDTSIVSTDMTSAEAKAIVSSATPDENIVGTTAYNKAYATAKTEGKSEKDAVAVGTIAKVNAIKAARSKPETLDENVAPEISANEAKEIIVAATPSQKIVAEKAAVNAMKASRKRGKSRADGQKIATIAAVRSLREQQNLTPVTKGKNKRNIQVTESTKIQAVSELPMYLEYVAIHPNPASRFIEMRTKRKAEANTGINFQKGIVASMAKYQKQITAKWNSTEYAHTGQVKSFQPNEIIISNSRLLYILPIETADIIVVNPIRGSSSALMNALHTLETLGVISPNSLNVREDAVVIFTTPFYVFTKDPKQINENVILLSFFLELKLANPSRVFVLSESNSEQYLIGMMFHGIRGIQTPQPLINMLEPTYIMYPYERNGLGGIIISGASDKEGVHLPSDKSGNFVLKTIHANRDFGAPRYISYKPGLEKDVAPEYLLVRGIQGAMEIPHERTGKCGLANYSLLQMMPEYHRRLKIGLGESERGEGVILAFRLQPDNSTPLCTSDHIYKKEVGNMFKSSVNATILPSQVQTSPVEVGGNIFNIRKSNLNDVVYNEWTAGTYSEGEAELLNTLNLSPAIMDKIFPYVFNEEGDAIGRPWKIWVANFLGNITINKSLMTHREMMISRNFLERVYMYFADRDFKRDAEMSDSDSDSYSDTEQPEPDNTDDITKETFEDIKPKWGELSVVVNEDKKEWVASFILVNRHDDKQLYRTIGVPQDAYVDEKAAREALQAKIDGMRAKYSDWIIIY